MAKLKNTGTTDLRTVKCPIHGETGAASGLLMDKFATGWVYLACGHYYLPRTRAFKNANQL